jgi:hypothetical protein
MMDMQTWRDGRKRADDATKSLRKAFAALGLPESIGSTARPVVTHSGRPFVNLGTLRAEQVEQLAEAIRSAVTLANPSTVDS